MEVDSGARYSILPEDKFLAMNLGLNLKPSNISFRAFSNDVVPCKGKVDVNITYKDNSICTELFIVPSGHDSLIGRNWIRELGIDLKEIDADRSLSFLGSEMVSYSSVFHLDDIINEFSSIFEEKVGRVPGFQISLPLRPDAKPVFAKARTVPYALRERVERELDVLEQAGIITPVATSDWGSPLVIIPKPDGSVRLCVDYKCGVNNRLVSANFPIRRIEDVLSSLRNSTCFCKLDLFKAYLHLPVDDQSSIIQTITTHKGTYRMNRLSFGIKTAPSEFNRILSQILLGLPKCETYFDDIIVHGATQEECIQNLRLCLKRLSEYDLHLNRKKCSFFEKRIEYLGHVIEKNKIMKSPEKVRAVMDMPRPKNVEEVRRFLGMMTYYSRFLPDFSSMSYPIRKLLRKNHRFQWTATCESAFLKLKAEMCSERVLIPYDPGLPIVLTSDASPVGIAAVLSHIIDGQERPVAYVSRSLTASERNYSQLDREALAIIFAVTRFYNYIYGRNFLLVTDNEPLSRIFGHNRASPQMTSARLLRYASFLSGFDYTVKYKKGKENENVDCLSRAPVLQDSKTFDILLNEEVEQLHSDTLFQISSLTITADAIVQETDKDQELAKIKHELQSSPINSDYILDNGILFKSNRIVIPKPLQPEVLKELHSTHIGITKMKQLARRYCIWKNIDKDIEKLVKSCQDCTSVKHSPAKAPLHHWDTPINNWDRIHIDYAGPFQGFYYLLVVDAKSRWVEIKVLQRAPNSEVTMKLLNDIFATHGYPLVMVSDNASIFTNETFKNFCRVNGIKQKFIAPGHPATNGLAERNVQTLKDRLKAMTSENLPVHLKIQRILFRYRATPLANGKSPAEMYLNRQIRIKLDAMFPYYEKKSEQPIKPHTRKLQVGERVRTKFFVNNKATWKLGVITQKLGHLHYIVKLDEGREVKRHINQLISTGISKRSESRSSLPRNPSNSNTDRPKVIFNVPRPQTSSGFPSQEPSPPSGDQRFAGDSEPVLPRRSQRSRRPPAYLRDYQL